MTESQTAARAAAHSAHRFANIIAGLQVGTTLNPVLQKRAQDEAERLERLVRWLDNSFARGDQFPDPNKAVDAAKPRG